MKRKKTIGQKKMLAAAMPESAKFWSKELEQAIPSTYPSDFTRTAEKASNQVYFSSPVRISSATLQQLAELCGADEKDYSGLMAASVMAVLYITYNGVAEDFMTGCSVSSAEEDIQVPLRIQVGEGSTFESLFRRIQDYSSRMQEHKKYPVELLVPHQHIDISIIHAAAGLETVPARESILGFDFIEEQDSGDYMLTVTGDSARYLEDTVRSLANRIHWLLEQSASKPQTPLLEIDLFSQHDRDIIHHLNATDQAFSDMASLTDLFDRTFEAYAAETAIVSRERQVTFAELDELSGQVAGFISGVGDPDNPVVGILAHRSIDFMVGVLGILRAGKAYLPLDPKAPLERNSRILSQSGAQIVLCSELYRSQVPGSVTSYALEAIQSNAAADILPEIPPLSLAYVIFTSGSTGLPKGVCVNHRSAVNRIEWMQRSFPLGQDDVILHKTPATFDVSVWEMFWWLIAGCRVALLPPNEEANPETIIEVIERNSVTTMHFVPSMLNAFLDYVESTGSAARLKSLRRVFCSGEALSPNHVQKFYALFGSVKLVNLYGPTEATVDVSCHIAESGDNPVPIGKPIDNIRLYIVDALHNQRPVGMVGELCIAGVGVSDGYINDASRTAERFLSIPSLGEDNVYMTGDLARLRHDQTIEYLGRNDRQVKVRGFRIELGEIETALTSRDYIHDAIVLGNEESDGILHLYAYVILADSTVSNQTIVSDLSKLVPKYMIPDKVIAVESMPLTPNGKVDKAALLALRLEREDQVKVLPSTADEVTMAQIWESVLGISEVGVTDNFFALGGNSINFVSVLALANEKGMNITFQQLFKHPTIRDLLNSSNDTNSEEELLHEISSFALISEHDRSRIPDGIEDAYPMSMLQAGLVYQSIIMQGDNNYHDIVSYLIKGEMNIDIFREAVSRLVMEQPIFRTSYNLRDFSEYMQLVHSSPERLPLNVHDLRGLKTDQEQDQWYEEWFWKEQHRPFEWESPGLVQLHIHILRDDLYRYSISQHNSALDGWSMNKVHTYLFQTYFSLMNGLSESRVTISSNDHNRNFIYLEQQSIKSETHRKFWADLLDQAPDGVIPRSRPTKQNHGNEVVFYDVELPEGLSGKLVHLANELMVPVKDILLASHVKFLSMLTSRDDVFMGYEIGGRPERLGAEDALGVFLNTMPFRVVLNDQDSWRQFIRSVYDVEAAVLPYRRYPMAKVKQDMGNMGILFETVFNFTHFYSLKEIRDLPGFDLVDVRAAAITEFPLRIEYSRHFYTDEIELSLHYHTAEFDEEDMHSFGRVFIHILESMVQHTDDRHNEMVTGEDLGRFTIYLSSAPAEQPQDNALEAVRADRIEQGEYLEAVNRVKTIWSSVLGKPEAALAVNDDFFLIGGSSLSAMKVSMLLEKQLSLKTIMQKSILHELAVELMGSRVKPAEETKLLQCLSKSSASALSIIFMPYAGGNALNFMPVARAFEALDRDVSVYAVELPGHDPNSDSSLMDFSSLAKQLADEIDAKMGNTPYVIWGHCVGTALAFEVTRQLEERSRAPKRLFLAAKVMAQPGEILKTIENAKRLVFADIAKFHAEWTGTSELSTLGEEYELHLAKSFSHDSVESNQYLHSLWHKVGDITLQTPSIVVVSKDDPATTGYAEEWSRWSNWIRDLQLKVFEAGGHYFIRTIQSELASYILTETEDKVETIPSR
ncbi:non-ribosomal peptide synthetase [Paenibacillus sambharensis]|nr:non-ribosomal peptide synthetase [Paenibacillus sambharensis]